MNAWVCTARKHQAGQELVCLKAHFLGIATLLGMSLSEAAAGVDVSVGEGWERGELTPRQCLRKGLGLEDHTAPRKIQASRAGRQADHLRVKF